MPPLSEQQEDEVVGPAVHHVLFGVATVAAYRAELLE
jgi:cobalamin biosynthesis protein CobD/CbiB